MEKMIMAVVPSEEASRVLEALVRAGFTATFAESRSGVLRQAQYILFIAVHAGDVEAVLDIINSRCHSQADVEECTADDAALADRSRTQVELGGAVVFVWDLDRFEIY
jgi:uncharacterized protein YaaQ